MDQSWAGYAAQWRASAHKPCLKVIEFLCAAVEQAHSSGVVTAKASGSWFRKVRKFKKLRVFIGFSQRCSGQAPIIRGGVWGTWFRSWWVECI